jgi:hypothetical protein
MLFALQHDIANDTLFGHAKDEYTARISSWLQKYDSAIVAGMYMPDWYVFSTS